MSEGSTTHLMREVDRYHDQLLDHPEGMAYFERHGVSERMVRRFRLGWVVDPDDETFEVFADRPLFPYLSSSGRVLQLRYDAFEFDAIHMPQGGWVASDFPLPRPQLHLFNVANALPGLRTNRVHLVSDVRSGLALKRHGARMVVVPGYKNWHHPWVELFSSSKTVVLCEERELVEAEELVHHMKRHKIDVTLNALPGDQPVWQRLEEGHDLGIVR